MFLANNHRGVTMVPVNRGSARGCGLQAQLHHHVVDIVSAARRRDITVVARGIRSGGMNFSERESNRAGSSSLKVCCRCRRRTATDSRAARPLMIRTFSPFGVVSTEARGRTPSLQHFASAIARRITPDWLNTVLVRPWSLNHRRRAGCASFAAFGARRCTARLHSTTIGFSFDTRFATSQARPSLRSPHLAMIWVFCPSCFE